MSEETNVDEQQQTRRAALRALAESILEKRDEAVSFRAASGVERQWREDQNAFDGMGEQDRHEMLDYATGTATTRKARQFRSKVIVNIIRGRCETAEGRFSDIQLPVDDKNYGLEVTPVPELSDQLKDQRQAMQNGKPITDRQGNNKSMADIAHDIKERAEKAMSLMEAEIDDQLTECDFNGECRKMIRDSIRLGTGIIKGPNVVKSVSQKWQGNKNQETGTAVYELESRINMQPASCVVDPWNVYPSPGTKENIQKTAEYIFEKDEMLPRDVRALVGVEGWDEEQIILALTEEPKRTTVTTDDKGGSHRVEHEIARRGRSYEKWNTTEM